MIGIGPSPEMKRIVEKYEIGIIANTFHMEDVANMLNNLSLEDIIHMKSNAQIASKELNAEIEMGKLLNIYHDLID